MILKHLVSGRTYERTKGDMDWGDSVCARYKVLQFQIIWKLSNMVAMFDSYSILIPKSDINVKKEELLINCNVLSDLTDWFQWKF